MSRIFLSFIVNIIMLSGLAYGYDQSPMLDEDVANNMLRPTHERLPTIPKQVDDSLSIGQYGGTLRMVMRKEKDVRQMVVYGYARLLGFDQKFNLKPDILHDIDVIDGRKFILYLRPNHRWSDGTLFTSEDFLFWWQDIVNNKALYPSGPPRALRVKGQLPRVYADGAHKVIYEWDHANAQFLHYLAKASPLYIYAPKHYLQHFHEAYKTPEQLATTVKAYNAKSWSALFNKLNKPYKNVNIDLPSLQPWLNTTKPPAKLYEFVRNPYFHRVDSVGNQLPYIDKVQFFISEKKLIPLKAATGEVDLQARYLSFADISLLKKNQARYGHKTYLWTNGSASHWALYPNLNHYDPVLRQVLRQKKFRQALSLAINRYEINRVLYFGLAQGSQNTIQQPSTLSNPSYVKSYTNYDLEQANALLDNMGLTKKNANGIRLLSNGKPLNLTVEFAGHGDEVDILSLMKRHWAKIGIGLYIKPVSLEVLRRRAFSGASHMVMSKGGDTGIATPDMAPSDFVPIKQVQYQWPKWGQYYQTFSHSGEDVDVEEAKDLLTLYQQWLSATSYKERENIWHDILTIHAEQLFVIGIIARTAQPVVVNPALQNVPAKGVWIWDPGAHFGVYHMDRFWFK